MSLDWRFTDKARFDALSAEEKNNNHCFVWGCMFVDMGTITEKNAAEWRERYVLANEKSGPFYYERGGEQKPWVPTLEDVKKRIGLVTNVSTKTRKQFEKKLARIENEKAVRS